MFPLVRAYLMSVALVPCKTVGSGYHRRRLLPHATSSSQRRNMGGAGFVMFHSLTVLFALPTARVRPSGLNATE
jgi:hypothetical protein